ncbi:MAG: D-alanine--D-alanine ligase [Roseburia sp.]|nr:D-alanine--D-alanine ligase [Roseburia sp.]
MIAVFFGGMSCEHDISIITGLQALGACGKKCVGVYIDGDGVWWTGDGFDSVNAVKNKKFSGKRVHIRPSEPYLYCKNKRLYKIDAALLCMHGMLGEDGALQGMLEMCGIPYTGSGVLASALGMNKLYSKKIFEAVGLKVLPYVAVERKAYENDAYAAVAPINDGIGYPVIVKPCNLGSSIGISVADNLNELYKALRIAFEWDDTVVAEKALCDFTEVNCAVLGDGESATASETEQPVGWKTFLTFSDKYSGDVKSTRHKIPADVGEEINGQIRELAVRAFNAVGAEGVARVDFLVKDGEIYVNEINTIPGSLACALFETTMDFTRLIDALTDIAVARKTRRERLRRVYTPLEPITSK